MHAHAFTLPFVFTVRENIAMLCVRLPATLPADEDSGASLDHSPLTGEDDLGIGAFANRAFCRGD